MLKTSKRPESELKHLQENLCLFLLETNIWVGPNVGFFLAVSTRGGSVLSPVGVSRSHTDLFPPPFTALLNQDRPTEAPEGPAAPAAEQICRPRV